MSERILLRPSEAAVLYAVSTRKFYDLMKVVPDVKAAIVELPGLRGVRLRRDLLVRAVERLSVSDQQD